MRALGVQGGAGEMRGFHPETAAELGRRGAVGTAHLGSPEPRLVRYALRGKWGVEQGTRHRHSWGAVSKVLCRWLPSPLRLFFQPAERLPQSRLGLLQRKDSAKVKVPTVILIFTSHCVSRLLTELRVGLCWGITGLLP